MILLVAFGLVLFLFVPGDAYTALLTTSLSLEDEPTVAIVDTAQLVRLMAKAGRDCGWYHGQPHRERTKAPYGWPVETPTDSPYVLTEADQYSLDHILATRFKSYPNQVPLLSSTTRPDFVFVPVLSQLWSNPWGCPDPNLHQAMADTTRLLRRLVQEVGPTSYPRIVLALSPIRSQLERDVFTPELMKEFRDSVVVVSIENALKTNPEGMKYTIDLPCKFALSSKTTRSSRVSQVFSLQIRPGSTCRRTDPTLERSSTTRSSRANDPTSSTTPRARRTRGELPPSNGSTGSRSEPRSTKSSRRSTLVVPPRLLRLESSTTRSRTRWTALKT